MTIKCSKISVRWPYETTYNITNLLPQTTK